MLKTTNLHLHVPSCQVLLRQMSSDDFFHIYRNSKLYDADVRCIQDQFNIFKIALKQFDQ